MNASPSITVVIPVFNEHESLVQAVHRTDRFLSSHFTDHEIVLVESGSTDGTSELCDELASTQRGTVVIHEGRRNGFGAALRLGYSKATKDLVMPLPVDLPFPLETITDAAALLQGYDCVLSYRSPDSRSVFRRLQSVVSNSLLKLVLGLGVRHVNSAFKLFRRDMLQSLPLISTGWLLDAEIILRLQQAGVRFLEIPVPLTERTAGKSKVGPLDSLRLLRELLAFAAAHARNPARCRSDATHPTEEVSA